MSKVQNNGCKCWQECEVCESCENYECECECCDCGDTDCEICRRKIRARLTAGYVLGRYVRANIYARYAVLANNSWGKPSEVIASGNDYDELHAEYAEYTDEGDEVTCTTWRGVRPKYEVIEFDSILDDF